MNLIQFLHSNTDRRAYEGILTPGGEHYGIGDGEGLVMTKNEDPPSGAPNGLQIWPPDEEQEIVAALCRETL